MYSSDKNEYNQHSPGSFFQKTIEPLMTESVYLLSWRNDTVLENSLSNIYVY